MTIRCFMREGGKEWGIEKEKGGGEEGWGMSKGVILKQNIMNIERKNIEGKIKTI